MTEQRQAIRKPTSLDIEFSVTEVQFGYTSKINAKGKIIDTSERGFGMVTFYFLQRGHVIIIKGGGKEEIPLYGLVKWIDKVNSTYRVGLGYRFKD